MRGKSADRTRAGGVGEREAEGREGGGEAQRRTAGGRRLARFLIIKGQLPPGERRSLPSLLSSFLSPQDRFLPCWSLSPSPLLAAVGGGGTLLLTLLCADRETWRGRWF